MCGTARRIAVGAIRTRGFASLVGPGATPGWDGGCGIAGPAREWGTGIRTERESSSAANPGRRESGTALPAGGGPTIRACVLPSAGIVFRAGVRHPLKPHRHGRQHGVEDLEGEMEEQAGESERPYGNLRPYGMNQRSDTRTGDEGRRHAATEPESSETVHEPKGRTAGGRRESADTGTAKAATGRREASARSGVRQEGAGTGRGTIMEGRYGGVPSKSVGVLGDRGGRTVFRSRCRRGPGPSTRFHARQGATPRRGSRERYRRGPATGRGTCRVEPARGASTREAGRLRRTAPPRAGSPPARRARRPGAGRPPPRRRRSR